MLSQELRTAYQSATRAGPLWGRIFRTVVAIFLNSKRSAKDACKRSYKLAVVVLPPKKKMGTEYSRPLPVKLPDFSIPTAPLNLPFDTGRASATVPIHLRREAAVPLAIISVPPVRVSRTIVDELIPAVFRSPALVKLAEGTAERPRKKTRTEPPPSSNGLPSSSASAAANETINLIDDEGDSDDNSWVPALPQEDEQTTIVSIEDTPLHRLLLHHALLGFTFQTAPVALRTLLDAAQPPVAPAKESDYCNDRGLHLQTSAALFERDVLTVNLHALSTLLSNSHVWAFTLAVEPSPYFGCGGLEARICMYGPRKEHVSFHLVGIAYPETDIPKLYRILYTLCPAARLKCLGVVTRLEPKDHCGVLGAMASSVIAYFCRLVPQRPRFITPDVVLRGVRPPLMPLELANASAEEIGKLVDEYRNKLEVSWSAEEIGMIITDHTLLQLELGEWIKETGTLGKGDLDGGDEAKESLAAFDKAWEFAFDRFGRLRIFVGALATAYFCTPKERSLVSITGLESSGLDGAPSAIAADLILQEQQFEELRTYVVR